MQEQVLSREAAGNADSPLSLKVGLQDRGKRLSCQCLLQPESPWASRVLGVPTILLPPSNCAHWS